MLRIMGIHLDRSETDRNNIPLNTEDNFLSPTTNAISRFNGSNRFLNYIDYKKGNVLKGSYQRQNLRDICNALFVKIIIIWTV